jgi:aryl-alcohol dehydrogenase-like predicted oxidoreductase
METRTLGKTSIAVTRLGVGLAAIGEEESLDSIDKVERVLATALDSGITFFDTAECYFDSEEMVGRTISARRSEFTLATKCGHAKPGVTPVGQDIEDWSIEGITASIDRSLTRLRTDYVDLLQLHSCSVEELEKGNVIEALQRARDAGKTRFIGYSGDNEAAHWAVGSGQFDTLQTSFNLADQRPRLGLLSNAKAKGMGTIAKRPIANRAWGAPQSPTVGFKFDPNYADEYWRRTQEMMALGPLAGDPEDPILLSLGFAYAHDDLDVAIIGTRSPEHMEANCAMVEAGASISDATVQDLCSRWDRLDDGGDGWKGQM